MMKQGLNQREVSVDIEMGLGAPRASWPHTGMTLYRTIRFKERIQCIGPSEFTGPRESVNVIPNWEESITGNYWAYYTHRVALGDAVDDAGTKLLPRKCQISTMPVSIGGSENPGNRICAIFLSFLRDDMFEESDDE